MWVLSLDTNLLFIVKTGEEDEKTLYQTKAKLYVMEQSTGNWKERGAGTMRINTKETASGTQQTRIVMRADTVFRVILNLPMFEGMKFLIMQDKFVRFAGFETVVKDNGKSETNLVNYALRVSGGGGGGGGESCVHGDGIYNRYL